MNYYRLKTCLDLVYFVTCINHFEAILCFKYIAIHHKVLDNHKQKSFSPCSLVFGQNVYGFMKKPCLYKDIKGICILQDYILGLCQHPDKSTHIQI